MKQQAASETPLFSYAKIAVLIDEAFVAARYPETGGPLSASRNRYLMSWAQQLSERLKEADIDTGHMSPQECVAMLLASALTLQTLYGKGDNE